MGYDVLIMPDHLGRQLSPVPALAAAAAATTRLRLSVFVFANDFRHPLMLAREAATLDILSGGRFELGLGAGWMTSDYRQLGMPYDRPGLRIDRLQEALPLVRRLLAGETVTHEGSHYRLGAASIEPRPVQRPHPPIAVGGGGPRILRFAAREADIVGLLPGFTRRGYPKVRQSTEGATAAKIRTVREAAGDRFDRIELNIWVGDAGLVGARAGVRSSVANAAKATAAGLVGSPYVLYGTLPRVRDVLQRRRDELGISYYILPGHTRRAMAPLVEALAGR